MVCNFAVMDIQADIKWIMSELKEVKDPYLVRALKNLLKSRANTEQRGISTDEYNKELQAAELRIASGEFLRHEDMLKAMDKW